MRTINGRESSILVLCAQVIGSHETKLKLSKEALKDIQPFIHETCLVLLDLWEPEWLEPMDGVMEMVDYMRNWVAQQREYNKYWDSKVQK